MQPREEKKKRVLICEDEPSISVLVKRLLEEDGIAADIAPAGETAREMIDEGRYDLYLIDMRLPVINGRDLYLWLKFAHPRSVRKVIFTSGDVMNEEMNAFLTRTGEPYLQKPFDINEIKKLVRKKLNSVRG
jgi:DNA-binding response OmpR family regulator